MRQPMRLMPVMVSAEVPHPLETKPERRFFQLVFDFFAPETAPHPCPEPLRPLSTQGKNEKTLGQTPKMRDNSKDVRIVELCGQQLVYELQRRKRKTIGMQVSEGQLRVSAPKWVSLTQIHEALVEKSVWILKQIEHTREKAKALKALDVKVEHGCELPWLGSKLQVLLQANAQCTSVLGGRSSLLNTPKVGVRTLEQLVAHSFIERLDQGEQWLKCTIQDAFDRESARPQDQDSQNTGSAQARGAVSLTPTYRLILPLPLGVHAQLILQVLTAVLKSQVSICLMARLNFWAQQFGVHFKSFKLSAAKTRWGSASQAGDIHLNWHLVHFSPWLMDYVVAHELCHLIHMNHSDQFWARLRQVMPDSELRKRALNRRISPSLLAAQ
jgi:predicted metal-dependent hydrolase